MYRLSFLFVLIIGRKNSTRKGLERKISQLVVEYPLSTGLENFFGELIAFLIFAIGF